MLEFNVSGQMLLLEGPSPGPHGGRKGQPFQAIARIAQLLPAGAHPLSLFSLLPLAERDGEVLTHGKAFNKCRLRTAEEFIRGALEERLLSLLTSNLLPTSGDPSRGWPVAIFLPRPPLYYTELPLSSDCQAKQLSWRRDGKGQLRARLHGRLSGKASCA